jgi:hypothetical protein
MTPDPIDILKNVLAELEESLEKSEQAYKKRIINSELYELHKKNLIPMISKYKIAIQKLL